MMRLVLTVLTLGSMAMPCLAQTDDFNPYQAVLDATPLAEAEPLIRAAYGALEDTTDQLHEDFAGEGVKILTARHASDSVSFFLFCYDRLAAIAAKVTPTVAATVLSPLTMPDGPDLMVNPSKEGVMVSADDPDINLAYWGVGTQASTVTLTYPWEVFLNYDFAGRCEDMATN